MGKYVIISISSDIGIALAEQWLEQGHDVIGTYRTASEKTDQLKDKGVELVHCDLSNPDSVKQTNQTLQTVAANWDVAIIAPGAQEPVGLFTDCDIAEWSSSIDVNFTAQVHLLHGLLPKRNKAAQPCPSVIFFAGGGTNNATLRYSAYTIAKIASIKMCELLDAEIPDTKFTIIGPGWVKTKIHEATLEAGDNAGEGYERTLAKLDSDECVPMEEVVRCVNWTIDAPKEAVGGRNLSLVFDAWDDEALMPLLLEDENMYKLRRSGNGKLERDYPISEKNMPAILAQRNAKA